MQEHGMQREPQVISGQVVSLRLIDLAYEINLRQAETLWAERTQGSSSRSRLTATPPKAMSFGVPPLALDLGPVALALKDRSLSATAHVRLYDFGIAALAVRVPVEHRGWRAFSDLVNELDRAIGPNAGTNVWDTLVATLRRVLAEALERPTTLPLQEDYLLAMVQSFDTPLSADDLLANADLVPLLSGETRPLSDAARRDLLRNRFSYYPDDLAVLTWDRAFLYEPRGETDVADVLEMANAQLLEMRTYDEMLDAELPRTRETIEAARHVFNLLASRRYARLARRLHALVAEVSELTERVDNALQVTEDVYLARVYAAAIDLFRVPNVGAAVDRKLASIRETYTALHSEAAGARAEALEIAILVLIALEIVLSLLPR
jgi:hypothetical protein